MSTTRFTRSFAGTTLVASALGLAALVGAGSAGALTADDQEFISHLAQAGFSGDTKHAIALGQAVCSAFDDGASEQAVDQALQHATGLSAEGAHKFVLISAEAYCKRYVQQTPSPQTPSTSTSF